MNDAMIPRRFKLFSLSGFVVFMDASWLPLGVLMAWTLAEVIFPFLVPELSAAAYRWMALGGTIGLFFSIIARELAQIVMARRLKVPFGEITLLVFGGYAGTRLTPASLGREALVMAAGALTSLVLGATPLLLLFRVADSTTPLAVGGVAFYIGLANLTLVLFNFLPAYPLSSGRVLCAGLLRWSGDLRWAILVAAGIGTMLGVIFVMLGVWLIVRGLFIGGFWLFMIGLLLYGAAETVYRKAQVQRSD